MDELKWRTVILNSETKVLEFDLGGYRSGSRVQFETKNDHGMNRVWSSAYFNLRFSQYEKQAKDLEKQVVNTQKDIIIKGYKHLLDCVEGYKQKAKEYGVDVEEKSDA